MSLFGTNGRLMPKVRSAVALACTLGVSLALSAVAVVPEGADLAKVKAQKGAVFTFVVEDEDAKASEDAEESAAETDSSSTSDSADEDAKASEAAGEPAIASSAAPTLSTESEKAITKAISAAEKRGTNVGLVLIDLTTGAGLGYNVDKNIFGASSVKAFCVTWVLQSYVDTGKARLTKEYPSGIYNSQGYLTVTSSKPLQDIMRNALVKSDNADYLALREDFSEKSYVKWLASCGIDDAERMVQDTDFPHYSARDCACIWLRIASYIRDDSENAQLLASWLSDAEFSNIGKALKNQGATIYCKAGWNADVGYQGCCEGSYVVCDGREYVLCVMTDAAAYADYDDPACKDLQAIAAAAFAARGELAG